MVVHDSLANYNLYELIAVLLSLIQDKIKAINAITIPAMKICSSGAVKLMFLCLNNGLQLIIPIKSNSFINYFLYSLIHGTKSLMIH